MSPKFLSKYRISLYQFDFMLKKQCNASKLPVKQRFNVIPKLSTCCILARVSKPAITTKGLNDRDARLVTVTHTEQ